jgi:protein gp37
MAKQGENGILWCDETWNPLRGCSHVSAGCDHCWAARMATRHESNPLTPQFRGFARAGHWTGKVALIERELEKPLHWRKPKRIAVGLMGDLFRLPDADIDRMFATMAICQQHTFLLLTKQAKRMYEYIASAGNRLGALFKFDMIVARMAPVKKVAAVKRIRVLSFEDSILPMPWPLSNVHLGVSAENQETLNERVPWLLKTPAAYRWLSLEPLLGPVDLSRRMPCSCAFPVRPNQQQCLVCSGTGADHPHLDHVVVGGESGPGARPMHPAWVRQVRDQCQAAGVPFTFKQWGEWAPCEPGQDSVLAQGAVKDQSLGPERVHWLYQDGRHVAVGEGAELPDSEALTMRVGRNASGRLIDGREWDGDVANV